MNFKTILIALTAGLLLLSCAQPVTDPGDKTVNDTLSAPVLVQKEGGDNTFDIMAWNIENFPKAGSTTINNVKTIIRNLDVDLIAVEEIGSVNSFNLLVDSLKGWQGVLSGDTYGSWYQKTGFLYKTDIISLSNVKNIFNGQDDKNAFPRPPLAGYVKIKKGNLVLFDFNIVVLHLKARGDQESEDRRRAACVDLKNFIDSEIASGADPDFIVLGDWNDQITDPPASNVFKPFLDNPDDFHFLTADISRQYSYISNTYKSLIDHIMITKDTRQEYGQGTTQVLYLDSEFGAYQSQVSDHRPVLSIFKGFTLGN